MDIQVLAPVISAVISGLGGAALAWKLKTHSETRAETRAEEKARRLEFEGLYENCYSLFEQAIAEVRKRKPFSLGAEFSKMNARIRLKAPDYVSSKYFDAAAKLEEWSVLYAKAAPEQYAVGEMTITIVQSPDPREKYKEAQKNAYGELHTALQEVVAVMQAHLATLP